jgi:hypothetical protein
MAAMTGTTTIYLLTPTSGIMVGPPEIREKARTEKTITFIVSSELDRVSRDGPGKPWRRTA